MNGKTRLTVTSQHMPKTACQGVSQSFVNISKISKEPPKASTRKPEPIFKTEANQFVTGSILLSADSVQSVDDDDDDGRVRAGRRALTMSPALFQVHSTWLFSSLK